MVLVKKGSSRKYSHGVVEGVQYSILALLVQIPDLQLAGGRVTFLLPHSLSLFASSDPDLEVHLTCRGVLGESR